jgi:hypothetical protein
MTDEATTPDRAVCGGSEATGATGDPDERGETS